MNNGACPNCGATLATEALGGACPKCLARAVLGEDDGPAEESLPRRFGDYELLERIAHGGMGVVYRARQVSLGRIVAVKMLLAGEFATREFVQRFRGEAAAAAVLQHPNIVAIHEVGVHEGLHFFSMDFVEGRSLADLVGHTPLPARCAAQHTRTIAEAIHYAHERGILHRDLKPSNVLIDANDQPRVTDFGLAKRFGVPLSGGSALPGSDHLDSMNARPAEAGTPSSLTVTGQVIGSPGFMPPEQAGETNIRVGRHSDVYSLGAVLYHALTARPPFQGETLHQVLQQAVAAEPVSPRRLNPAVPLDLETICLKCLAKEPARRYVSAQEVADELGRFLAGEPIRTRPVGVVGRVWRWCRRKPSQAGLTAALVLALLGGLAGVLRELRRVERAERETEVQLGRAYLEQARANRRTGRSGQRFDTLEVIGKAASLPVPPSALELRHEAVAALALADMRWLRQLPGTNVEATSIAFERGLERYAWSDRSGAIHLRRMDGDQELFTLPTPGTNVSQLLNFSRDGRWLAVAYAGGRKSVWDLQARRIACEITGAAPDGVVDFAPRHDRLVVTGPKNSIRFHDLPSGRFMREFSFEFPPRAIAFSPDARWVSVRARDSKFVLLVEAETGTRRALWHPADIHALAWHPTENRLATVCADFSLHLWDAATRESQRIATDHQSRITGVAWHPVDSLLVTCSWDGHTKLWDAPTGKHLATAAGYGVAPAFSNGGERLAFLSERHIDLWEISASRLCRFLQEPPMPYVQGANGPWSVEFSPDERLLISASFDGLRFWDPIQGRELAHASLAGRAYSTAFHPDGHELITTGGRSVSRWPVAFDTNAGAWTIGPAEELSSDQHYGYAAMSTNGSVLAYGHGEWTVVWKNGQRAFRLPQAQARRVAVSPDGRWIASASSLRSETKLWNAETGQLVWTRHPLPRTSSANLVFTPDSQWLVTGGANDFQFWNAQTGEQGWQFPRQDASALHGALAFTRDGKLMALSLTRTLVQLRDLATGAELARLESPNPQMITWLSFNASGTQLAVAGENHVIQLWDLRALRQELAALGLDWEQTAHAPANAYAERRTPVRRTGEPTKQAELEFGAPLTVQVLRPPLEIPPRPPDASSNMVDLTRYYTASLQRPWEDPNNNLVIPPGIHRFGGVPYDVRGVVSLRSVHLLHLPKSARDIPLRRRCARLHFLQATGWSVPHGTPIGAYVIHYADGQREEVLIRYGVETYGWWLRANEAPGRAERVWAGTNTLATGAGYTCALFHFPWENTRPEVEVASIDFVSFVTECTPFLVAITAEE